MMNREKENAETVEMELTTFMFEKMKDTFDLEVEILQGEHRIDGDMHRIKIKVGGYKLRMIKDFFNLLMSTASNQIKVKVMGVELHKN